MPNPELLHPGATGAGPPAAPIPLAESALPGATAGLEALRLLSVSHRSASLDDLERLALPPRSSIFLMRRLRGIGIDSVALTTCNRSELYWRSADGEDDAAARAAWLAAAAPAPPREESVVAASGLAAAAHLFRVAAGLESLVVGEAEVLGQVREAVESSEDAGCAGCLLSALFHAAVHFGGRARSETGIGAGALSVASAAVQLLERMHGELTRCTVVVVGSGATGLKVARHLRAERVGRLVLVNRTVRRSIEAAAELGGEAAPLGDLNAWLPRADAVVTAVQVERHLITAGGLAAVRGASRPRPLALIDLSLPRAIEPGCGSLPGVVLHDLSGLEQIVAHNRARREREIPRVEALLARALERLPARARASAARPLVAQLRQRAEAIRREELERALRAGPSDAQALDRLSRRLVERLLQAPTAALRRGDAALDGAGERCVRSLFGLDRGKEPRGRG